MRTNPQQGSDEIQALAACPHGSGAVLALCVVPVWKQDLGQSNPTHTRAQIMAS